MADHDGLSKDWSIMKNPAVLISAGGLMACVVGVASVNYAGLQRMVDDTIAKDARNKGIEVFAHYKYFVNPNVLVYDLRKVSEENSPMDVTRVLLQFSEQLKERKFDTVELSHRGANKFVLKGEFFQTVGQEHGLQNPIYTIRTLPENVYKPDGSKAYGEWSGGLLGVLGHQMEDFADLHRTWYIDDLAGKSAKEVGHVQ
ncbi:hypothetical protein Q4S45_21475 [Massilia sp. R2A-15]|uniref:hypothetical protein n=1 Tax=Massilia sp. R2A-15 TaxID=3064278 RepID=UPI0027327485|nr:hypothetical protein [Massilia sp. R2A-15]WLI89235.1 hypothetical protein Q4S45_21475 [Massilia sp. R2A-15]